MHISSNLVAYALISANGDKGQNVFGAYVPFFSEVLRASGSTTFFPERIAKGMAERFGIEIPTLAIEGMIPSLVQVGFLKKNALGAAAHYVAELPEEVPKPKEDENFTETVQLLSDHVKRSLKAKSFDDSSGKKIDDAILDALVQPKIWHGNRRWAAKAESTELLNEAIEFHTLEYVLESSEKRPEEFERLARIAASGLAISFLKAFRRPSTKTSGFKASFYFDTRLVASALGLGDRAKEKQMMSMLKNVKEAGGDICVLEENASELHSILLAATNSLGGDGREERAIDRRLRTDAGARQRAQHYLSSPERHIKSAGFRFVDVKRDYKNVLKHFSHANTEDFIAKIRQHGQVGSRAVDAEIVANIGRFLRQANRACHDLFQMPAVLVSDNLEVVLEGNKHLEQLQYYDKSACPPCIMDSHLAAACWISAGQGSIEVAKEHLIANCSALVDAHAELFRDVKTFLGNVDPNDVAMFEGSIANDRSALMLASQFVGTAKPVDHEISVELLSSVVQRNEERMRAEFAVEREILQGQADTTLAEVKAENDSALRELDQRNQDLQSKLEEQKTEGEQRIKKFEERFEQLEKEVDTHKRRATIPYFLVFTGVLLVLSNSLGLANFSATKTEYFGVVLPSYVWTSFVLVTCVGLSVLLTKLSSRL
ncbi:MAG: hypothetical protein AAFQ64_19025 [Pseudomonadota bacterium]